MRANREWTPDVSKITGIVWGGHSSQACLFVTKVEHIKLDDMLIGLSSIR